MGFRNNASRQREAAVLLHRDGERVEASVGNTSENPKPYTRPCLHPILKTRHLGFGFRFRV